MLNWHCANIFCPKGFSFDAVTAIAAVATVE